MSNQDPTSSPSHPRQVLIDLDDQVGRYRFCVYKAKSYWETQEFKYKLKIQQGTDFSLENAANKTHVMDLQGCT